MNLENTIAIKVVSKNLPAQACLVLKRLTGLSLAEVKQRVSNEEYLYICEYTDDEGLKRANTIRREMEAFNLQVRQFEDGVEKSSELFDNIERLHGEIDKQYDSFKD